MKLTSCAQSKHSRFLRWMACGALIGSMMVVSLPAARAQQSEGNAALLSWVDYRGNPQRSGYRDKALGALPNLVWQYTTTDEPQAFYSSPLVTDASGNKRVYFAASNKIYALDGDTGATLWITPAFSFNIIAPPLLASGADGDLLFCLTSSGDLIAVSPINGKTLKTLSMGLTVQSAAPVPVQTANGERLIIGTSNGRLLAVDPQKMSIDPDWNISLGRFGAAVTSTPALTQDGKYLYVPAQDENIYVVNVAQGKVYYPIRMRFGVVGSPVIAGNNIIVANGPVITCLKAENGQTRWAMSLDSLMNAAPAVAINDNGSGTVYVGTSNGTFYALNLADGKEQWRQTLPDAITSAPTALKDMVLVGTQRGLLVGMDPGDKGHIKWQFRLNTERVINTSPFSRFRSTVMDNTNRDGFISSNAEGDADDAGNDDGGNDDATSASSNTPADGLRRNRFGEETTIYAVSHAPVVVGDTILVAGDNVAVYAFNTQPFDANAPLLQNLKPYVNNTENELQDVSASRSIPGRPPVILKGKLVDEGSGVDADSIKILINNQPLPPTMHKYDPLTGELEIRLTGTTGQADSTLQNGRVVVTVQASDYLGNQLEGRDAQLQLQVDNSQSAPQPPDARRGGWGGRGGWRR